MAAPAYARRAFTLIELMVVIAIIATLAGLLLPAVQRARETGRRTSCTSNLFQLAFAANRFDESKGFLPGWRNRSPHPGTNAANGTPLPTWAVMLLPHIERNDIYREWANNGLSHGAKIGLMICPSSPSATVGDAVLAYAGNCGSFSNIRADGVMVDTTVSTNRISNDDISEADGTANTLLFAEKCGTLVDPQANWATTWVAGPPAPTGVFPGFGLWGNSPPVSPQKIINATVADTLGVSTRPSAVHPGGAVVAFCDGHTLFLSDTKVVAANVYAQLLSPQNSAVLPTSNAGLWRGPYLILSEDDYKD